MSLCRFNTRVDWDRLAMQDGKSDIPADHPDRVYLKREKEAVAALSPELLAERERIINKLAMVSEVYDRLGSGMKDVEQREMEIEQIRRGF